MSSKSAYLFAFVLAFATGAVAYIIAHAVLHVRDSVNSPPTKLTEEITTSGTVAPPLYFLVCSLSQPAPLGNIVVETLCVNSRSEPCPPVRNIRLDYGIPSNNISCLLITAPTFSILPPTRASENGIDQMVLVFGVAPMVPPYNSSLFPYVYSESLDDRVDITWLTLERPPTNDRLSINEYNELRSSHSIFTLQGTSANATTGLVESKLLSPQFSIYEYLDGRKIVKINMRSDSRFSLRSPQCLGVDMRLQPVSPAVYFSNMRVVNCYPSIVYAAMNINPIFTKITEYIDYGPIEAVATVSSLTVAVVQLVLFFFYKVLLQTILGCEHVPLVLILFLFLFILLLLFFFLLLLSVLLWFWP
jgi:hypothetical protein